MAWVTGWKAFTAPGEKGDMGLPLPPAHLMANSELLGAEAIGWASNRTIALLLAMPGEAHIRLVTYNLRTKEWSEPPVEGTLGSKWKKVGSERPTIGNELFSDRLQQALHSKQDFTKAEVCALNVPDLTDDSFITVDGEYFQQAGGAPPIRRNAAMYSASAPDNLDRLAHFRRLARIIVFGGSDDSGRLSKDLFCLTLTEFLPSHDLAWRWTTVKTHGAQSPTARAGHAMCSRGEVGYVHGGTLASGSLSAELWELECQGDSAVVVASWSKLSPPGGANQLCPRGRTLHTMCCIADKLYLDGGAGTDLSIGKEVWTYDLQQNEWHEHIKVRPGFDRRGSCRISHSCCACGPLYIIAGGHIHGYCDTDKSRKEVGVQVFDSRDERPSYVRPTPEDLSPGRMMERPAVVSLNTSSFLLLPRDMCSFYVGEIALDNSPSVVSVSVSLDEPPVLTVVTLGALPPETTDLLIRLENGAIVFTVKATRDIKAFGLIWKNLGRNRPTRGTEIFCKELRDALRDKQEFTKEELDNIKVPHLQVDSFIQVDDEYFQQAVEAPDQQHPTREWGFRPPPVAPEWSRCTWHAPLPSRTDLVKLFGFAEGVLAVEVSVCSDKNAEDVWTSDLHEIELRTSTSLVVQGLLIEHGNRRRLQAGQHLHLVMTEVVWVPASAEADERMDVPPTESSHEEEVSASKNDDEGLLMGNTIVRRKWPEPGIKGHRRRPLAPKVWLTKGMVWRLTRKLAEHSDPEDGSRYELVAQGVLEPTESFQFQISQNVTKSGAYELTVQLDDETPVPLLDAQRSIIWQHDFDVVPGPVKADGASAYIECPPLVANGHFFKATVTLSAEDAYGNAVELDPQKCHLECHSRRTGHTVFRQPLLGHSGTTQAVEICVIEPLGSALNTRRQRLRDSESGWTKRCEGAKKENGEAWLHPAEQTVSILDVFVNWTNDWGEYIQIGSLQAQKSRLRRGHSCIQVVSAVDEQILGEEDLSQVHFGITVDRIRSLPDCGERTFAALAKLRREVRNGLVQCVKRPPSPGRDTQRTRYFHVVNVLISDSSGGNILMEYARMIRHPVQSNDPRLGVVSSKFGPHEFGHDASWSTVHGVRDIRLKAAKVLGVGSAQAGQESATRDDPPAHICAANDAIAKVLKLDMTKLEISCKQATYRTDCIRMRSKLLPDLLSVFVIHQVEVSIHPVDQFDFYVSCPEHDSFFTWRSRHLVDLVLMERRRQSLEEVLLYERGVDLAPNPASSWLAISMRGHFDEHVCEMPVFLEKHPSMLNLPGECRRDVDHRARTLRTLCSRLYDGAQKLDLVPLHQSHGVLKFFVIHTGRDYMAASILVVGSQKELTSRAQDFGSIVEQLHKIGQSSERLIGPGPPVPASHRDGGVIVDDHFWGARADIHGGLASFPEFSSYALALSLEPLSRTYVSMMTDNDPTRCVNYKNLAKGAILSLRKKLLKANSDWNLSKTDDLAELVAMSYRAYDVEFRHLELMEPAALDKLLSMADEELWESQCEKYPLRDGRHELQQPSLGYDDEWRNGVKGVVAASRRYDNLMRQAASAQLYIKQRLLGSPVPISEAEMQRRWPTKSRTGGLNLERWGTAECYDPGLKSRERLQVKAKVKYNGNLAQVKDVSRLTLYYENAESLLHGIEALRAHFKCVRIENRFRRPTVCGWRDVTLLVEVPLENEERHISELKLQLHTYTIAREIAHHYYNIIRTAVVSSSNIQNTNQVATLRKEAATLRESLIVKEESLNASVASVKTLRESLRIKEDELSAAAVRAAEAAEAQEYLLQSLLDATCRVSRDIMHKNYAVLENLWNACFGEIWNMITCHKPMTPKKLSHGWCIADDFRSHDRRSSSLGSPMTLTTRGPRRNAVESVAHRTKQDPMVSSKLEKAASVILQTTRVQGGEMVGFVVRSTLRKLNLRSWDFFNGACFRDVAEAILASSEMRMPQPEVFVAPSHNHLRLGDLLCDLGGNVWCSVLDGVAACKQASYSPVVQECQLTYGSVQLRSITDLVEAFSLSSALADLGVEKKLASNGVLEYTVPPSQIRSYQSRQSFVAAASVRQYAWFYSGDEAAQSGSTADLINLQLSGALARHYLLRDEFLAKANVYSIAWAFLGMCLNFTRASGVSEEIFDEDWPQGGEALSSGHGARHRFQMARAAFVHGLRKRSRLRKGPRTGVPQSVRRGTVRPTRRADGESHDNEPDLLPAAQFGSSSDDDEFEDGEPHSQMAASSLSQASDKLAPIGSSAAKLPPDSYRALMKSYCDSVRRGCSKVTAIAAVGAASSAVLAAAVELSPPLPVPSPLHSPDPAPSPVPEGEGEGEGEGGGEGEGEGGGGGAGEGEGADAADTHVVSAAEQQAAEETTSHSPHDSETAEDLHVRQTIRTRSRLKSTKREEPRSFRLTEMTFAVREAAKGSHPTETTCMEFDTVLREVLEKVKREYSSNADPTFVVFRGSEIAEGTDLRFERIEQERMNDCLSKKATILACMYTSDCKNLIPYTVNALDLSVILKGLREPEDALQAHWKQRFGVHDRRYLFLKDAQVNGDLFLLVSGLDEVQCNLILLDYLFRCGAPLIVLTFVHDARIPSKLAESQKLRIFDVLYPGPPVVSTEKRPQPLVLTPQRISITVQFDVHTIHNERHARCSNFFLRWKRQDTATRKGTAWVDVYLGNSVDMRPVDSAISVFTISHTLTGLSENTPYKVSICAANQQGMSEWTEPAECWTLNEFRQIGTVGPLELLCSRFRPPDAHFVMLNRRIVSMSHTFDESNHQQPLLSFCCPPANRLGRYVGGAMAQYLSSLPTLDEYKGDAWSHRGHFACVAASSAVASNQGIKPYGPENVLQNRTHFYTQHGDKVNPLATLPCDYRPREGSSATWVTVSHPNPDLDRYTTMLGNSRYNAVKSSDHCIYHEMVYANMNSETANVLGEKEPATVHAQAAADPRDPNPILFVALPVGCLLEEIILIDGYPSSLRIGNKSRLENLSISIYHLNPTILNRAREAGEANHFEALYAATSSVEPLWTGEPGISSLSSDGPPTELAAVVNLRRWAHLRQQDDMAAENVPVEQVGSVIFGRGEQGIATLPESEAHTALTRANFKTARLGAYVPPAHAHGVIGNVIRIQWTPSSGRLRSMCDPLDVRFCIGGVTIVGRRIVDPILVHDLAFLREQAEQEIGVKKRTD